MALSEAEELELLELEEQLGILDDEEQPKGGSEELKDSTTINPLTAAKEFPEAPEGFMAGEYSSNIDLNKRIAKRVWDDQQTMLSVQRGDITPERATINKVGSDVGKALDVVLQPFIETAVGAGNLGLELVKAIDNGVKDTLVEDAMKSGVEVVKSGAEVAKEGLDWYRGKSEFTDNFIKGNQIFGEYVKDFVKKNAGELYDWWKGLDKETRKTIFAGGNIASVIPGLGQTVGKTGSALFDASGKIVTNALNKQLTKSADNLVQAVDKASRIKRRQKTGTAGYQLDATEKAESAALQKVKGFDPQKTVEYNNAVVVDALNTAGKLMEREVKRHGTTIDPLRADVALSLNYRKLPERHADFSELSEKVLSVPRNEVDRVIRFHNKKINGDESVYSTASLHKARQELGSKIDWKKDLNITDETYKEAYHTLNKLIDESMPTSKLPEVRNTYHQLFKVNGKMAARAEMEAAGQFHNAWDFISKGAKSLWAAKTVDKIALGGTLAASGAGAPTIAAIIAGGWGVTRGVAVVKSPQLKRLMIEALKQADKNLAKATGADRKQILEVKRYLIKTIAASRVSGENND